jgi:hypothetical protein
MLYITGRGFTSGVEDVEGEVIILERRNVLPAVMERLQKFGNMLWVVK